MKRFDLMMGINTRGTYCCSRLCVPHLISCASFVLVLIRFPCLLPFTLDLLFVDFYRLTERVPDVEETLIFSTFPLR